MPKASRSRKPELGTTTTAETVETALDMVGFRDELLRGTRAIRGMDIEPSD